MIRHFHHRTVAAVLAAATVGCLATSMASAGRWNGGVGDYEEPSNWIPAYVPGTNPEPNVNEDFFVMSGEVTLSTDVSAYSDNWRDLLVNAGNNGAQPVPTDGTSFTITSSAYLRVKRSVYVGMGSALNISGTIEISNGSYGDSTRGAHEFGPAIVNMTGGTYLSNSDSIGSQGGYALGHLSNGSWSSGPNGTMTIGSGALHESLTGNASVFTQSGGTMTHARGFRIGYGHTGIFNLENGTVTQTSGDADKSVRIGVTSLGQFNMTSGTANLNRVQVGPSSGGGGTETGVGVMTISGGNYSGAILELGSSSDLGSGTLRIIGSESTITLSKGAGAPAPFQMYANGTLNFQIGASGITPIVANGSANDGRNIIKLAGTLDLDLMGGFVPTEGQTFTLLTTNSISGYYEEGHNGQADYLLGAGIITESLTYSAGNVPSSSNTGLSLAAEDVNAWTFSVVALPEGAGHALVATYVPEPTGLLAAGLALAGLAVRRRAVR